MTRSDTPPARPTDAPRADTSRADAPRTGGRLVVETLRAQGVERLYGVPGESFLEVLDALVDAPTPGDPAGDAPVRFVATRHEGAAAMMADADGKMTGRPGVAIVTRGPGATNASAGVHVAAQDSTPIVLLVGLIARGDRGREAFQEFDLASTFSGAKLALTIEEAARVPELLGRAWRVAVSGRPGPVVIGLPEDVLREEVLREEAAVPVPRRVEPVQAAPDPAAMERLAAMLAAAERPLVIAGGETWDAAARANLVRFAEAHAVPVATSFRAQDRFPNDHPRYAGHVGLGIDPALQGRVRASDCLIVAGARLGDATTDGYALLPVPEPGVPLVHAHPDANEIGRVYRPTLAIASGMAPFAAALTALAPSGIDRAERCRAAHADYLARSTPGGASNETANEAEESLDLARIVAHVSAAAPDAVTCNGAGNYAIWVHRYTRYRGWRAQLAPTSGSMGYGLPAAIAARLREPTRDVIAWAGDGCFQMTCQELGTAAQEGAVPLVIVCDNGQYGTIRMHQEGRHPGRVSGTRLVNPDFAALARAYRLEAATPATMGEFEAAFEAMRRGGGLIHLRLDPDVIAPGRRIGG